MFIDIEKNEEQIAADILAQVPETYQKSAGFFTWDYSRAISFELKRLWDKLAYLCKLGDLNNYEYDDLVKFVYQRRGIVATKETFAAGSIKVANGSGLITVNDIFETQSGLQFVSLETKEVNTGDTFMAQCLTAGSAGNVPADTVVKMPYTIPGIVEITNEAPFSGGYEKETKEHLIQRYLDDLQKPIASLNIYHYEKWANECPGVGRAIVKPTWNGNLTVKILIVNAKYEAADNALINLVQRYIDPFGYKVAAGEATGYVQTAGSAGQACANGEIVYTDFTLATQKATANGSDYIYQSTTAEGWGEGNGQAPIGARCTVASMTNKNISVSLKIKMKQGGVWDDVQNAAKTVCEEYFKEVIQTLSRNTTSYLSYAKINTAIMGVDDILDISELKVNGGVNNVELLNTAQSVEIPYLSSFEAIQDTSGQ